jgi:hypothetical protein
MAKRKVESQIANLNPDHKKSRIDLTYLAVEGVRHTVQKLSTRATTCFSLHCDSRSARKVMGLQSYGSPIWCNFETPIQESRVRKVIWMYAPWPATKYTIRGKVMVSPKSNRDESGPWCVKITLNPYKP